MEQWLSQDVNPIDQFRSWFDQAQKAENFEPTAMTLATLDSMGFPSARVVLLKDFDSRGLVFFTNYESVKGQELTQHPKASLVFHWPNPYHRQVRFKGDVEKVSYEESNAYFQTRARGSQIGAWASPQSSEIKSRQDLEERVKAVENKFQDKEIPCPPFWGGFRLKPSTIEFWQSQEHRLHNRMRFVLDSNGHWSAQRLAP